MDSEIKAKDDMQQEFFELAERFRDADNPEEAKRLGDELGRMIFPGRRLVNIYATSRSRL
jgi:hypothetical protein